MIFFVEEQKEIHKMGTELKIAKSTYLVHIEMVSENSRGLYKAELRCTDFCIMRAVNIYHTTC